MKYTCAYCQKHACHDKNLENAPIHCPSCHENQEEILSLYQEDENYAIANVSSQIVMDNYGEKTRLKEIIDFCKKMADIHPLITVFGVVIGLSLFGFMGVIFGPLLLSLFFLFVDMFKRGYLDARGKTTE